MFNYKKSISKKSDKPLKTIATLCPFNEEEDFSDDDFSLEDDDSDSGLFFECKMCKGAQCSGYLRK